MSSASEESEHLGRPKTLGCGCCLRPRFIALDTTMRFNVTEAIIVTPSASEGSSARLQRRCLAALDTTVWFSVTEAITVTPSVSEGSSAKLQRSCLAALDTTVWFSALDNVIRCHHSNQSPRAQRGVFSEASTKVSRCARHGSVAQCARQRDSLLPQQSVSPRALARGLQRGFNEGVSLRSTRQCGSMSPQQSLSFRYSHTAAARYA